MKLLIVEDQVMFREALCKVCTGELGHKVVGECGTGAEAVELAVKLQPDALLLDLTLPDFDGLAVVDRIRQRKFFPKVLILSSHVDDYSLFRIEHAGVNGFVDKNENTSAVLGEALQAVAAGRAYYSAAFQAVREARRQNPKAFTKILTEWELQILALIGLALSDDEIAARLAISPRTAQTHRSNIMRKLQLPGTPKLMLYALEHGFSAIATPPRIPPKKA